MTTTFAKSYFALLALLGLTWFTWKSELPGRLSLAAALLIALAKAFVVVWYFMEVRKGPGLIRLILIASVLWLAFLFSLGGLDVFIRSPAAGL